MRQILNLFFARNKEYYRDRGSLAWSFIMPPLIIGVVALAFSGKEAALLKVGVFPAGSPTELLEPHEFIDLITIDSLEQGQTRVQYHQIDLLINNDGSKQYYFNPASQKADVVRALIDDEEWEGIANTGRRIRYIDWAIPGILAMNLMFSGLYGVGYVIVRYRKNGVLKRLQASPVSPINFLIAQMLSRLVIMLSVSIVVYAVANLFLGFVMLGSYFNLLLIAIAGNICILSLGLIVASRLANEELANGLLNFLTFPMLLLSEIWFSLEGAPAWMSTLSQALPLTHVTSAARAVMLEGAGFQAILPQLLILVAMSIIFLGLSARFFRWQTN